jgi:chromate transporter
MPTLTQIAVVFTRYANLTLGGGSATAATLHRELVEKRHWLTDEQFTLSFALGRVTPGTNLLAFCTGFGYLLRGLPGAIVVLLASSIPCAIMVAALTAVVITRSTPGPVGLYVVAVGYFVAGIPGAIAGWAAMTTPALLILPLVHLVGRKLENPRVKTVLETIVIASAGLLLAAAIPLAREALTDWLTVVIAVATVILMLLTKIDTLWIVLGAAAASLAASSLGLLAGAHATGF